ncbi:MAG: lysophospholipid acyltransferase family protein [Thermodesulfobacteriota bacterium]|nr:lysophospholipid acyltransferase family protein [Thermodesulfobacteriota bacterium]
MHRLSGAFLYWVIRLYSSTFRLIVENESILLDCLKTGRPVLLCCYHQQFFAAIRYCEKFRFYRPSVMISRSDDGEVAARVALHCGWAPVRGSSSKGGIAALKKMIRNLKTRKLAAHIVDGPQGPAGIVKPGTIQMAHMAGATILPFYIKADRAWYFNSWDRFFIPKPFSTTVLRFGHVMTIETLNKQENGIEQKRLQLEDQMKHESAAVRGASTPGTR